MGPERSAPPAGWQHDLVERARERLDPAVFRYLHQGAREGVSASEAGWSDVRFAPYVLRDVTEVSLDVDLLGTVAPAWAVAPTTLQRVVHPDGDLALARACAAEGVLLTVSSNTGTRFALIGETGVAWWLQAYLPADRSLALPLLEAAVAAGARAVVLTVDTPVVGTKDDGREHTVWDLVDPALLRVNFAPGHDELPGAEKATDLGPDDIGWLSSRTGLPVVVKGVLRPGDARRCVDAGAAAVWVSNHGGRQLDRSVRTAAALPGVVAEAGDVPVYVDGGVRTGLDVLAALALGARAAFLGRLPVLGLVEGQAGVAAVLARLRAETLEAFRLAGCRRPAEVRGLAFQPGANPS